MVNRIWPTAFAGEADSVSSVSASACHIGGPNSVKPGQILLLLHFLGLKLQYKTEKFTRTNWMIPFEYNLLFLVVEHAYFLTLFAKLAI